MFLTIQNKIQTRRAFKLSMLTIIAVFTFGSSTLLSAQINNSFSITEKDLYVSNKDGFDELSTSSNLFIEKVGHPQLPVHIESFILPYEATDIKIEITSITKQKVTGNFNIYPTQPPIILDGRESPEFVAPDLDIYNSNAPFPAETAEIVSDYLLHGYRVVSIKIYPLEYIPSNKEVFLKDINYTINYSITDSKSSSIIYPEKQTKKRYLSADRFIRTYVKNTNNIDNFKNNNVKIINESNILNDLDSANNTKSVIDELVPDYIIITNEELKPIFQELADWKTKKGVPAIIKTTEEIETNYSGADLPEKIRNYLKDAYSKWGADLFILLGGDVNVIPPRMIKGREKIDVPVDLYYSTVEGTWNNDNNNVFGDGKDYGRDFYLGRASVEDTLEASTFVNKVINYEKGVNFSDPAYVNNVLVANAFLSINECGVRYSEAKKYLTDACNAYKEPETNHWFMFDNSPCTPGPYSYNHNGPHCDITPLLHEGFDKNIDITNNLPLGWQKDNNYWERVAATEYVGIYDGSNLMRFKTSEIGVGNRSSITSPTINIPDNNHKIQFSWFRDYLNNNNDAILFEYELNNSGTWVTLQKIINKTSYNSQWLTPRYKLPKGNIQYRITGISDGGNDMYIDDIYIATDFSRQAGGYCAKGNEELNENNFISSLSTGGASGLGNFHIVYHMDHSSEVKMGTSSKDKNESIIINNVDELRNGNNQQIIISGGCKPATFTKDCIGEHFINNPNGGAVAFIGNADIGYADETNQFQNFISTIYEKNRTSNLGHAFEYSASASIYDKWSLTLLGDPEMPIWTKTPTTLNVDVSPTTIVAKENTIIVTVNNLPEGEPATICLMKDNEAYATKTISSNGNYDFVFTPHTSGKIDITVTAHNFIPYEESIDVNINDDKNIFVSEIVFDDDKIGNSYGNNDKQNDAGETIELSIGLKNNGVENASNVSATLICNSPNNITISNNQSNFGDIISNNSNYSLSNYVFTIDPNATEINVNDTLPVKFILQIKDSDGKTYTDAFNIDIFDTEIEQGNKTIISTSNGDNIIEPNEIVTINIDLFNAGKAQATGIKGVLSSNSPFVTECSETPRNYPTIGKYGVEKNTIEYQFTTSPSYITGEALYFELYVENEYGKSWPFNFNLLDRPTRIDASAIDFTAYESEIEIYEKHDETGALKWVDENSEIKGYNFYRSNFDSIDFKRVNTFIVNASYFRDYNLEELTKYYYKISAVSKSGNESELSDSVLLWTSYPTKGLFPVLMHVGTGIESPINTEDIDHDGMQEIFTTTKVDEKNAYIIGLDHIGKDLYNIDGNVTSNSGFVHVNGNIESGIAIGDLENNGEFKIISGTRDEGDYPQNNSYIHSVKDTNMDNIPDLLREYSTPQTFRAPVISNIDNSPDGSKEAVIFHRNGQINIYDCKGMLKSNIQSSGSYGAIAVADIDNDGDKEIISGNSSNLCIWHHDGSNYGNGQPFYSLSGYTLRSSVVVCDIDNDGDKEILTSALKDGAKEGRIVVIHHNGAAVLGWNGDQRIECGGDSFTQEISLGDLNNDDTLEVVAIGTNVLKIWSNTGTEIQSVLINNLEPGRLTPLLADVDEDNDVEVIFGTNSEGLIHAYNIDGSKVLGFPLRVKHGIGSSPCIVDIDNNGNNEIVACSGNEVYMWETNGSSEYIEWGRERHNSNNTGEYYNICKPTIINSNTTWRTDINLCGDIIINQGRLTISSTCKVTMSDNTRILIKSGGKLQVYGGEVLNANIKALDGSGITLRRNGYIKISNNGEFAISPGAILDYQEGIIDITNN